MNAPQPPPRGGWLAAVGQTLSQGTLFATAVANLIRAWKGI